MVYNVIPWGDLRLPFPQWNWWFGELTVLFLGFAILIGIVGRIGELGISETFVNGAQDMIGGAMPIMAPLADTAGVDRSLIVTAYLSAGGLLNLVNPTFALAMGGLALGRVRYDKWLRFTLPLLLVLLVLYAVVLSIGTFFPDSIVF